MRRNVSSTVIFTWEYWLYQTHTCAHAATIPEIIDYEPKVIANEWAQVTLRVNFTGSPKPTVTWMYEGTSLDDDYAIELNSDGSLLFICAEKSHEGR